MHTLRASSYIWFAGGVVPNLAMEAHRAAIDHVVDEALAKAGITPSQLDAVAVTVGPGLSLCLRVGAGKAYALAAANQLPLVRVHHMEAHALVARAVAEDPGRPAFPFLCLLVSGGHNLLVLVRGVGSYVQLGTTLDDALGELLSWEEVVVELFSGAAPNNREPSMLNLHSNHEWHHLPQRIWSACVLCTPPACTDVA